MRPVGFESTLDLIDTLMADPVKMLPQRGGNGFYSRQLNPQCLVAFDTRPIPNILWYELTIGIHPSIPMRSSLKAPTVRDYERFVTRMWQDTIRKERLKTIRNKARLV